MFEGEFPFEERLGEEGFLRALEGLRRVFREDMRRSKRNLRNDSIYGGSEDLTSERTKAVQTAGSSPRWGAVVLCPYNANSREKIAALLGARRRLVRGIEGNQAAAFLTARAPATTRKPMQSMRIEDGSGALILSVAASGAPLTSRFEVSKPL